MKPILILLAIGLLAATPGCKKSGPDLPSTKQAVGASATDYLRGSTYTKLHLEIVYVDGFKPNDGSVANLKQWLEQRLHKPGGVVVTYRNIPAPAGVSTYTAAKLREIEDTHRQSTFLADEIPLYMFFADKGYEADAGNSKVLGVAYRNTSTVIFEKTIHDYSGGIGEPARVVLETTVMLHEAAHLLGLVDNGTPMVQAHRAQGAHCDNQNCLMYHAVETTDFIGNLLGGNIPQLDQNCLDDLKANGGR
jgi:hypothetical protein